MNKIQQRESNFETLRITAMIMVVMLHCNYFVLGDVNAAEIAKSSFESFIRMFWDQLCTPCVNLFILLSGWFGIHSKLKGGISLLFQVVFYTLLSIIICKLIGWEISLDRIYTSLTCQMGYWFILPYLLLYITAPAYNILAEKAPHKMIGIVCSLLIFEFAMDWVVYYAGGGGGKSYIAFVTLYLIGRILSTQDLKIKLWNKYTYLMLFFIMSLIPTIISFYGEELFHFQFGKSAYTNPFVIASSVFLILYFSKLHFTSNTINWLACSSFSIYLIHMNPLIAKHFKEILFNMFIFCDHSLITYSLVALLITVLLSLFCMLIDKIRIFVWDKISILIR